MSQNGFDLAAAAYDEMTHEGFQPDFAPGTNEQLAAIQSHGPSGPFGRDLRGMLWSSIDNDTSRDLDQIEVAERIGDAIRVLIAIADVSGSVAIDTPVDRHAAAQTTSVYTGVRTFPMLPELLSTDLTSLAEAQDRRAIVIEMVVGSDGAIRSSDIYPAMVHNQAQLTYNAVGAWLEESAPPPPKVAGNRDLQDQLKLQDSAAQALLKRRQDMGALDFARIETQPILSNGQVKGLTITHKNRATQLIEDFMIGANEIMARRLTAAGIASIRRVVKSPERWSRIVDLASRYGEHLPPDPDSAALNAFLQKRRADDPVHYPDISLAVLKLMGPGEYVLVRPGEAAPGHFGLAALDYTHSTAPNRRFADLVTQRLIKALLAHENPPYSESQLEAIASNCTLKEDAARKVERNMAKRIAAVALHSRVGQTFPAVVTGNTPKGVFVRVFDPPVEGRLLYGEQGADVGDQFNVKLINTDPQRGFIDFARA